MKQVMKLGFTAIEVTLFLGITGFILISMLIGTSHSISQQRYNDSVQNFAEFLRGVYSKAVDIEGNGGGRSEQAIYGKLITFGESYDLVGEPNHTNSIFIYDIIGDADGNVPSDNVLQALYNLNANVVVLKNKRLFLVGMTERYDPKWMAKIENPNHTTFKGAILVVRSPLSGTIYTYILQDTAHPLTIEVNQLIKNFSGSHPVNPLKEYLDPTSPQHFTSATIDFCINSSGSFIYKGTRYNIRLSAHAHSSSGVEVIPLNDRDPETGNRC